MCDDHKATSQNSGAAQTCESSPNNQSYRIWRNTANQASDFKHGYGSQIRPFHIKKHEDTPVQRLESRGREEVGGSIPTDVVGRVEFIRDKWDGLWK